MSAKRSFHANGKLILTSEYGVLNGSWALGIPLRLGQSMIVTESSGSELLWKSLDPDGKTWFQARFDLIGFEIIKASDEIRAQKLSEVLNAAIRLNSDFLSKWKKYTVTTTLGFSPEWGFGSSSSFISCLADWAEVNPYHLLFEVSKGSGCDLACARADGPILYRKTDEELQIEPVDFNPPFSGQLYLVYLGRKVSSSAAVEEYLSRQPIHSTIGVDSLSEITRNIITCNTFTEFCRLIIEHEKKISSMIGQIPIGRERFTDFDGVVKSLGAWGGDFILAASELPEDKLSNYFHGKNLTKIIKYKDLVLH